MTERAEKQTRKSSSRIRKEEELRKDLERFKQKAVELGASAADIVPADWVVVDERVRMKCLVPRCRALADGGTPYCPPHTPEPDFMRKVFARYQWAVIFKNNIELMGEDASKTKERQEELRRTFHEKTQEIVDRLESFIQSEGYDLAMGFTGGCCKTNLCHGAPCGVFQNGFCRFPLRARPSMEAVGIDVIRLAEKVGWEIYMIRSIEPDLGVIPYGTSAGIVFIY